MILPAVRDPRLVTVRRGGTLTDEDHHRLALWAAECAEHVLPLFEAARPDDLRPREAIAAARAWTRGELPMMQTRALGGHAMGAARDLRGAPRFAAYAAGAAAPAGHEEEARRDECRWQRDRLPVEVRDLVVEDQRRRNAICWDVFDD